MSCKPRQLKYLDEVKKTSKRRPAWVQNFLNQNPMPPPINCGGYKIVYPFGDFAVSIESGKKPIPEVVNVMKLLPQKYQKHLIYPLEAFFTENFTITKLSICPYGDLYDLFFTQSKSYSKLTAQMFVDLAITLDVLHSYNIAVVDLKPENIMMCTCNCLAFIDLDSVLSLSNGPPKKLEAATPWNNPIVLIPKEKRQPRDFFVSDWAAFAIVVMFFVGIKLKREKNYGVLLKLLDKSSYDPYGSPDYVYKLLRPDSFQNEGEYNKAFQLVDMSPMKPTVVEKAFLFLNNLIQGTRYSRAFNTEADSYIYAFQDALGMDKYFNGFPTYGRFRLKKRYNLKLRF